MFARGTTISSVQDNESLVQAVKTADFSNELIGYDYAYMAKSKKTTPKTLDAAFSEVTEELLQMFLQKHHDYGKGNILANKELGIAMRVSEKIERLKHLLITGNEPTNELIEETWVDIAVYGIIAVLYRRGLFQSLEVDDKVLNGK